VFSILVEFITRNSWSEAFEADIPQRKYHDGKKKRRKGENGESASPSMQDGAGSEDEDEEMDETAQEEMEMSRMEEEEKNMAEEVQGNV
jgi:Ran GTPase-activating protein (RanGAP) involved in mRNA processing and transport